jgi:serine/threonine protein kinase/Tfp pilus assembly protein PilF
VNSEQWQRVKELFEAALERGPAERSAFLAQACAGNDLIRQEVESLLAAHEEDSTFMNTPVGNLLVGDKLMLAAGQRFGPYEDIFPLGEGGMGQVYLAVDTRLGRKVALKLLLSSYTDDADRVRRFGIEARAASALNHPNIVTIHEIGETDSLHFIATEFVDGETLRQHITKPRMTVGEVLDVAVQVASALQAAHAAGIVHRDIKPENIMLRHDGYAKILDFGLAKLTEKKSEPIDSEGKARVPEQKTSPGMVMGTVAYMSPEQARGLAVDARTDVWSLGVVMYEMLTGRQPFDGGTPTDVIISIAEREPAPLRMHVPEVPTQLERIVKKALAKDREQRYRNAEDLLIDLKNLKHELEIGAEVERYKQSTPSNGSATTTGNRQLITSRLFPFGLTRSRILILAALAGVLIIAGLAYALFFRQSSPSALQTEIKSLAVLPLENPSGDTSQDYFAVGMTDALITDLAKVGALRVISLQSVMQYKGVQKPLPDIGRELNVDAVLTGSIVRSGERVRIAVQLIHAATGRNLWEDSYDRNLRDVLALQREVTRDIVGEIRIKLTPQEQMVFETVRPVIPEAYDHYLRGKFYLNRQTEKDNETAITALEHAVATDPTFAAAHAELAQAYVWKLFFFAPEEKQWAEKAFVAAEKALSLDPNLAVAYLARGLLLWTPANHFPHEKAIREFRRALSLNPNLDEARNQLARVYFHVGAFDEALQESQKAITTNPNNNLAQLRIGQILNFQLKYEQALSVLRAIPRDVNPALVGSETAWALFNLGKKEETSTLLEQLLKDYPEDNGGLFTSVQAVLAASAGQGHKAEDKIKLAIERGKGFGHFHHTAYHIACAYALMNKPEQAIKWLDVTADDGFPCYPLFERDANLDNLRQDARFVAFLAKQREQWEHYKTIL